MKRFKLLLVALATISFTAFYACNGAADDDATDETEVVDETTDDATDEPVIEEETEVPDSNAVEEEVVEETDEGSE